MDSGASMHMISKKDLNDAEMDTLTKSCSPTIVITANSEVQTHEEATVYVKELDIFLTMKVLENTPAGFCRLESFAMKTDILMNGSMVKNTSHLKRDSDNLQHGELRSSRGSRLVNEFFFRFLSFTFKDTFKTREALFYIFLKLVFFTDSNIM